jgi:succinate-semialdehyde dehydrogenase/glutarate-semialdehyde dehydrogenase
MTSLLNRIISSTSTRIFLSNTRSISMSTQRAQLKLNNPSLLKSQAFVNNEWVSSRSGKTFKVTNPANNEVIGEVPEMGTEEEVEEVIAVAKKAFESWRNSPPKVSLGDG